MIQVSDEHDDRRRSRDVADDRRRASALVGYADLHPHRAAGAPPAPPQRRTLAPLLWSGIVLMVLVAGTLGAQTVAGDQVAGRAARCVGQIVFAAVPFTFLVGLLRGRVARADAVGELLVRLGEASGTDGLRGLLADALDDRVAAAPLLGRRLAGSQRDGQPAELPPRDRALDAGRARGPARRRDRPRPQPARRARGAEHASPPPPAWRCAASAWRRRCGARAPGSSRRA